MNIKINRIEKVFEGKRFNVERREISIDGKEVIRDIVVFPESVVILPLLREDTILLIKQYRPALNNYIYEVPAGVVEPGEPIREAALRELEEEIGYTAKELVEIGSYYPTPGYSTEKMHFFIAKNLEYTGAKPEPYEVIEPYVIRLEEALKLIKDGVINDLKTVAIIMLYTNFYKNGGV
ncbi:MAG: NUDIX hydrolase [Thermoprotei archaeon]